jgi:hypothetical protein
MHAKQIKKYGKLREETEFASNGKPKKGSRPCKVEGCKRPYCAKGYCAAHYERFRRLGTVGIKPIRGEPRERYPDRRSGYVWIYVPPGTPNAHKPNLGSGKRWSIEEHRWVMQQMLGRPLFKGESVHHRNGLRYDNRPENLELWVKSQPSGARATDLVEWAYEIIRRYDTKPVLRVVHSKDDTS